MIVLKRNQHFTVTLKILKSFNALKLLLHKDCLWKWKLLSFVEKNTFQAQLSAVMLLLKQLI